MVADAVVAVVGVSFLSTSISLFCLSVDVVFFSVAAQETTAGQNISTDSM